LKSERQASADREALAKAETETRARLRAQVENDQRMEADRRARAESDRNAAQSEAAATKLEAEAARVAAQTEADRVKRANDAEADRVKAENDAARAAAQATAEQAALTAAQAEAARTLAATQEADRLRLKAEAEKAELRAQLLSQFNSILETRDTARGLIVNMWDVLLDTAQFTLRPGARERLAKVAGILLGHPGLKLEVEGHTDSVGGEAYNQHLSEQRAGSVRDYLISQGILGTNLSPAKGFGESQPVATNDTATGRQQNRRVELIVSGDLIGTQIALSTESRY
jgi:outer membrane protein OmpA-like peptidoglycan-associated protein